MPSETQLLCLKPHPCVLTGLGPTCGEEEGGDCVLSEGAPASLLPDSRSPWLAPTSERAKVVEEDGMDLPLPISPTPYPAPHHWAGVWMVVCLPGGAAGGFPLGVKLALVPRGPDTISTSGNVLDLEIVLQTLSPAPQSPTCTKRRESPGGWNSTNQGTIREAEGQGR